MQDRQNEIAEKMKLIDENEKIPTSEKRWDTTPRTMGIYHVPENEEE